MSRRELATALRHWRSDFGHGIAGQVGRPAQRRFLVYDQCRSRADADGADQIGATGLRNPALLEFADCDGMITQQNDMWSIHPVDTLDSGKQDEVPVPGRDGIRSLRDFHFAHIPRHGRAHSGRRRRHPPAKPLDGFLLSGVTGTCGRGISLSDIRHAVIRDIHVSGFAGALLMTRDVTGQGRDGAVPLLEGKAAPDLVPEPATPFVLH